MQERILYVSRAAPGLAGPGGLAALHALIRAAHGRNGAAGVTGALVLLDGWFAQVIEGPPGGVGATWARILADPRHEAVTLRARERALVRRFPGQPMALRTAACLDPALLADFDYRPGFPAEALPADALAEFLVRACRAAAPDPAAAPFPELSSPPPSPLPFPADPGPAGRRAPRMLDKGRGAF